MIRDKAVEEKYMHWIVGQKAYNSGEERHMKS